MSFQVSDRPFQRSVKEHGVQRGGDVAEKTMGQLYSKLLCKLALVWGFPLVPFNRTREMWYSSYCVHWKTLNSYPHAVDNCVHWKPLNSCPHAVDNCVHWKPLNSYPHAIESNEVLSTCYAAISKSFASQTTALRKTLSNKTHILQVSC